MDHASESLLQRIARRLLIAACHHDQVAQQAVEIRGVEFSKRFFITCRQRRGETTNLGTLIAGSRAFHAPIGERGRERPHNGGGSSHESKLGSSRRRRLGVGSFRFEFILCGRGNPRSGFKSLQLLNHLFNHRQILVTTDGDEQFGAFMDRDVRFAHVPILASEHAPGGMEGVVENFDGAIRILFGSISQVRSDAEDTTNSRVLADGGWTSRHRPNTECDQVSARIFQGGADGQTIGVHALRFAGHAAASA